jgi:hypothetical protein
VSRPAVTGRAVASALVLFPLLLQVPFQILMARFDYPTC